MKKIIVIFKTHLDLGFTDFAGQVEKNYLQSYIPAAMDMAKAMRGEKERFIWTTGSWLVEKYLEEGEHPELLEEAICHGDLRWHGLPFTTHTELMDQELFAYGLGISKKLDERFGRKTIAAKMTDVPGHTKAIIAPLYRAGIRFLHIGVNPASTPPKVPELFRWRNANGEDLVVMYHKDYGEMSVIGASDTAAYFAHTGDNRGPQSVEEIRGLYRMLHAKYPGAEIMAGTLEDVAAIAIAQELPVVTEEIGDTWIHGAGTDPRKMCQYRALLRLKDQLPQEDREILCRKLLCVPEHTWGLDEKMYLGEKLENGDLRGEHRYFEKEAFRNVRGTEKFRKMEYSWQEQRQYLTAAMEALPSKEKRTAKEAMEEYKRCGTDISGWKKVLPGECISIGDNQICVTEKGEIELLSVPFLKGMKIGFCYEVFSQKEYDRFRSQYMTSQENWAVEDFGKIGVAEAVECYRRYEPCETQIWYQGEQVVAKLRLPEEAIVLYGGMRELEMKVEFEPGRVKFDFAWFGKEISRIPEAAWVVFYTGDRIQSIQKMGEDIRPDQVVPGGNRRMHAADEVRLEHGVFRTLDAPLIAIGGPCLLNFTEELPRLEQGFSLNLYNNVWGTNFPMWYGEDARFRFEIETL